MKEGDLVKANWSSNRLFMLIIIPAAGFVLLGATFILDFLFQSSLDKLLRTGGGTAAALFPSWKHLAFALLIFLLSWLVLRSAKVHDLVKAVLIMVPTGVALATEGLYLYRWPVAVFAAGAVIVALILFRLYRARKPWFHYYAVALVTLTLLAMTLLGVDI